MHPQHSDVRPLFAALLLGRREASLSEVLQQLVESGCRTVSRRFLSLLACLPASRADFPLGPWPSAEDSSGVLNPLSAALAWPPTACRLFSIRNIRNRLHYRGVLQRTTPLVTHSAWIAGYSALWLTTFGSRRRGPSLGRRKS
jgi:hypothetical protein